METITLKCLHKEPQHRYATASQLSEDLECFLNEEPMRARPIGPVERVRLVDLDGRADVILLGNAGISRLDGRSTKQIWSLDPKNQSTEQSVFNEAEGFRWPWWQHTASRHGPTNLLWQGALSGAGQFDLRPELVSPAPDLDGDGVGDLVLAAQHQAWLLAVSGKQGTPLWLAPRGIDLQQGPGSPEAGVKSAALRASILADINADQVVDLLATFVDVKGLSVYGLAVTDGEVIWRSEGDRVVSEREPVTPTVSLVSPNQPHQPPHVLYQYLQRSSTWRSSICGVYRRASFVGELGEETSQYPEVAARREVVVDRRYHPIRRLPWVRNAGTPVLLERGRTLSEAIFWGFLIAIVLVILPAGSLRHIITRQRFTIRALSLILAVIALAFAVAVARPIFLPLSLHSMTSRFLLGLTVLPLLAMVWKCSQLAVTLRWRQLLCWFVFLSIVAAALAITDLHGDRLTSGGSYSLEGWYFIFLPAAYITGVLLLLIKLVSVTWRGVGHGVASVRNCLSRTRS